MIENEQQAVAVVQETPPHLVVLRGKRGERMHATVAAHADGEGVAAQGAGLDDGGDHEDVYIVEKGGMGGECDGVGVFVLREGGAEDGGGVAVVEVVGEGGLHAERGGAGLWGDGGVDGGGGGGEEEVGEGGGGAGLEDGV